ncbi:MAG: hypothetical protein MPN21_24495 [Thermoanaerobaculia bacterium]|nr:hypothetical protein [Thermoanaerobaculia bacterium]
MSRYEAWTVHLSVGLVGSTGLIYAWMLYFMTPSDPFSVLHHPLQPHVQHAHVWFAPLLVFGAGLIWRDHIWKHLTRGVSSGRRSGLALLLTLVPMVLSGYLIQTAVGEGWRSAWIVVHVATSGLWLAGYGLHIWARIRRGHKHRKARESKERKLSSPPVIA